MDSLTRGVCHDARSRCQFLQILFRALPPDKGLLVSSSKYCPSFGLLMHDLRDEGGPTRPSS